MAATTGTDIDRQVRSLIQDKTTDHITAPDMLDAINRALQLVVDTKPKAMTATANLTLAVGTKQTLDQALYVQMLDALTNLGTDGVSPGRGISVTTMDRMNAAKPGWRADTGAAVRHVIIDDRDNSLFYTWPGPAVAMVIEARVIGRFTKLAVLGAALPIPSEYDAAVVHLTVANCYLQDAEDTVNAQLAMTHLQMAAADLGVQIKALKKASAPANGPDNPAYPATDKNGA